LLEVPFSISTFAKIRQNFQIHPSIVRVINRGCAVFSRAMGNDQMSKICTFAVSHIAPDACIAYNLRTSNMQSGDIAMSVSSDLQSHFTKAIFFGCKDTDKKDFVARLKSAGKAIQHPMLLPGIFVEIQRKRHVDAVESSVTALLQHITGLGHPGTMTGEKPVSSHLLDLWIDIGYLSSCIETWKEQLTKMVAHIDDLAQSAFRNQACLRAEGNRIKERLLDIIIEYNELCRKSALVSNGTSLANGIVGSASTKPYM
jgi:hypothetical protein